ncbi:hypothetical protein [Nonomuraea diastatica]|uniref:hypothetical protein n=1 Tax=Nonomuraea diastatica TaxID=1848329 RepID=UPI0015F2E56D|nr:hypothetical protein [Nonomuraea diastatica]
MDRTYPRADLTVDQQHALLTAVRTLAEEFAGTFGTETIDRFLHTSHDPSRKEHGRNISSPAQR